MIEMFRYPIKGYKDAYKVAVNTLNVFRMFFGKALCKNKRTTQWLERDE